jgi:hypothetical protein
MSHCKVVGYIALKPPTERQTFRLISMVSIAAYHRFTAMKISLCLQLFNIVAIISKHFHFRNMSSSRFYYYYSEEP